MMKTIEATIEPDGQVHLREPLYLSHSCRAIITLMEEPEVSAPALLSEPALGEDWNRPEEDDAWSHLQQVR